MIEILFISILFRAANISFSYWTQGCLFPWGSTIRSGSGVSSRAHCIDISNSRGYGGCVCHVNHCQLLYLFLIDLFQNLTYQTEREKAYGNILFQHYSIAFVALLFGSSFHATYCGSWWRSLDAKSYIYPECLIFKTCFDVVSSLRDSWHSETLSLLGHSTCLVNILQ